jgi:hypothetical protein
MNLALKISMVPGPDDVQSPLNRPSEVRCTEFSSQATFDKNTQEIEMLWQAYSLDRPFILFISSNPNSPIYLDGLARWCRSFIAPPRKPHQSAAASPVSLIYLGFGRDVLPSANRPSSLTSGAL